MRGTVEIHDDKPYCGNKYYLPHKIVEKLESTSSPYRVVFDAGAPCPISKESLNDNILDNPRINNNLQAIEMASRFYWILILADIWKLYLQIGLKPEFWDYLRFLWRDPEIGSKDKIYCFKTLIWGIKDSGFQSIAVLNILLDKAISDLEISDTIPKYLLESGLQSVHKLDAERLNRAKHSFYVDDVALSFPTVEEGLRVIKLLQGALGEGSLKLKKFVSNSSEILKHIPEELREECEEITNDHELQSYNGNIISKPATLLGYTYRPKDDTYVFSKYANLPDQYSWPMSKLDLASIIPKIYDPIGLVSAFTLKMKLIMRKINEEKLDWTHTTADIKDEGKRTEIESELRQCLDQFKYFNEYTVRRHVNACPDGNSYILITCDASSLAVGVSIYVVTKNPDESFTSNLLRSTADLAPKPSSSTAHISIPKKELFALKRATEHYCFIVDNLLTTGVVVQKKERIVILSDSKVALAWLSKDPSKLVPFCKNKVSYIKKKIDEHNIMFYHVGGKDNPSDLTSRSLNLSEMINNPRFLHGDEWMRQEFENYNIERYDQLSFSDVDYSEGIQKKYSLSLAANVGFNSKLRSCYNIVMQDNESVENFFMGIKKVYTFSVSVVKSKPFRNFVDNLQNLVPAIDYFEKLDKVLRFTGWVIYAIEKFKRGLSKDTRRESRHPYRKLIPHAVKYYEGSTFPQDYAKIRLPFVYKNKALCFYIIEDQKESFADELNDLLSGKQVKMKSKISGLNPFLDSDGVIKSRSRVAHISKSLTGIGKCPIILDKTLLAEKILSWLHDSYTHGKTHDPINNLKNKALRQFYILNQHSLATKIIKNCRKCQIHNLVFDHQLMGEVLSKHFDGQIKMKVWEYIGVDSTGAIPVYTMTKGDLQQTHVEPVTYHNKKTRLKTRQWKIAKDFLGGEEPDEYKAYLIIFVDFLSKNVNVEVVSNASTENFLMAFQRHCSNCATPSVIISDQAPIFKKADKIIRDSVSRENLERAEIMEKLNSVANDQNIEWYYTDKYHSWTAANWESRIKSLKGLIYKQASKRKLTFEELETIAKQATLVMNDTPVNARYTGSNVECLTPAMLAIGRNLDHFNISPELMDRKDLKDDAMADNFKIRNQIKNQFFTEWLNTYFGKLRERPKWKREKRPFAIGDIVICRPQGVKFKNKRINYFMGQVQDIHIGRDGVPRTYTVNVGHRRFNKHFAPTRDSCKVMSHSEIALLEPAEKIYKHDNDKTPCEEGGEKRSNAHTP